MVFIRGEPRNQIQKEVFEDNIDDDNDNDEDDGNEEDQLCVRDGEGGVDEG